MYTEMNNTIEQLNARIESTNVIHNNDIERIDHLVEVDVKEKF